MTKTNNEIFVCKKCNELGVAWCDYDCGYRWQAHCQKHVDMFLEDGGGLDFVHPLLNRKVILPDPETVQTRPRPETWEWEMYAPIPEMKG
jgi:hypothetical protein